MRSDACPGLLARVEPSGTVSYWVQVARSKRMRLGNAKVLTLGQAIEQARRVLVDPEQFKRDKVRGASLGDFIEDSYLPWRKAKYPKTYEGTKARLDTHFEAKFYPLPLEDITVGMVEKWVTGRLGEGKAPATVERDVSELRTVLSKAVAWGALQHHPLHGLKHRKVDNAKVRFLSAEEEQRLRAALDTEGRPPHLKPMVLVSMNTGLRRGELSGLLRSDVDLDSRVVTVRAANAKANKTRTIPLNAEALGVFKTGSRPSASRAAPPRHSSRRPRRSTPPTKYGSSVLSPGLAMRVGSCHASTKSANVS